MTSREAIQLLDELRSLPSENEWLEFKKAQNDFHFDEIGKYFSALSNEANLKGKASAWLIFGVDDKTHSITGTQYRAATGALESLKHEIAGQTTNRISFADIHELALPEGRVIMFEIPPAPRGVPVAWKNHYYGRDGESLVALNLEKLERIRRQPPVDWSAVICEQATMADLDPAAIQRARLEYKRKVAEGSSRIDPVEVDQWDDMTFLNKVRVTVAGEITRTAIILLGKPESVRFIDPATARMSWILRDQENQTVDYQHFDPPFLLNTDALFARIRNLTYRYLPDQTLFPTEIKQYDSYVIREALHNCIAHQDYEIHQRINVIETPDELIFSNAGAFIPGTIDAVIDHDAPQEFYRNPFLANAMVNLNLIDTVGSGIIRMFSRQRQRLFPLPDYDLTDSRKVVVHIYGRILDERYTRALLANTELSLRMVILLDRVQKKMLLTKEERKLLKAQNLVEGRFPNLYISGKLAGVTGERGKYIRNRAFDDSYYKDLILKYLAKYGEANRREIDDVLLGKLSEVLTETQKSTKVRNLIHAMSKQDGTIENIGSKKMPRWVVTAAGRNKLDINSNKL